MGRRIIFLPPDNASLMRYIYLKLCISSPCQGLRGRPRVSLWVCFRLAGVRTALQSGWLSLPLVFPSPPSLQPGPLRSVPLPHPSAQTLAQPFGFRPHLPAPPYLAPHIPSICLVAATVCAHVQQWPRSPSLLLPQT